MPVIGSHSLSDVRVQAAKGLTDSRWATRCSTVDSAIHLDTSCTPIGSLLLLVPNRITQLAKGRVGFSIAVSPDVGVS